MVEVSSGLASIKLEDKVAIVKHVQNLGLKAKPEVSLMIGAGAGSHIVGYKPKMRKLAEGVKETTAHLDAGAKILMLESEGITEDSPPSECRKNVINQLVKKYSSHTCMLDSS